MGKKPSESSSVTKLKNFKTPENRPPEPISTTLIITNKYQTIKRPGWFKAPKSFADDFVKVEGACNIYYWLCSNANHKPSRLKIGNEIQSFPPYTIVASFRQIKEAVAMKCHKKVARIVRSMRDGGYIKMQESHKPGCPSRRIIITIEYYDDLFPKEVETSPVGSSVTAPVNNRVEVSETKKEDADIGETIAPTQPQKAPKTAPLYDKGETIEILRKKTEEILSDAPVTPKNCPTNIRRDLERDINKSFFIKTSLSKLTQDERKRQITYLGRLLNQYSLEEVDQAVGLVEKDPNVLPQFKNRPLLHLTYNFDWYQKKVCTEKVRAEHAEKLKASRSLADAKEQENQLLSEANVARFNAEYPDPQAQAELLEPIFREYRWVPTMRPDTASGREIAINWFYERQSGALNGPSKG